MYLSTYIHNKHIHSTTPWDENNKIIKTRTFYVLYYYNHRPLYFLTQKRGNKKEIKICCWAEL